MYNNKKWVEPGFKGDITMDNQQNDNMIENIAPETAPKVSFFSKILKPKIILPIIAAVLIIIVGAFAVSANTDRSVTDSAVNNLFDRVGDIEAISALSKAYKEGRVSVSVGEESDLIPLPIDISVWMNERQSKGVAKLSLAGEEIVAYSDEKALLYTASMLKDTYGIEYEGMYKRFFESDGWTTVKEMVPEEYLSQLEQMISSLESASNDVKKTKNDTQKYVEKYVKLFKDLLWEHAEKESANDGGNRVITITVDEKAVAEIFTELVEKMSKDKNFLKHLDKLVSLEDITDGEYSGWKELFTDKDMIEEATDAIEGVDFKIKAEITASSIRHNVKALKITLDASGSRAVLNVDMTEKNTTVVKLSAGMSGELETIARVKYVENDDGFKLSASTPFFEVNVTFVEKDDSKFKLTVDLGDEDSTVTVEGKYENNRKHFYLYIGDVTAAGETMKFDLTVEFVYKEKMPEFPKEYKEMTTLTNDDLEKIGQELSDWFEEFKNSEYFEKISSLVDGLF